jgi:hypothetical protein
MQRGAGTEGLYPWVALSELRNSNRFMRGINSMAARPFPKPWTCEDHNDTCFIVKDRNGRALAYVYHEEESLGGGSSVTRAKGFRWSTGRSDTRSALGSSETNGPCPFIPQTSKALEESSAAPVCERSC